jgi:argininosuccinate lyase
MRRLLALSTQNIAEQAQWIASRRGAIDSALAKLDSDFARLLAR